MNTKQICSVCSAPVEVQQAVNAALANRTKMRDIALAVGISKSSIHRHSQKCVTRTALNQYRGKREKQLGKTVVKWPDGTYTLLHIAADIHVLDRRLDINAPIPIDPKTLGRFDAVVEVIYEQRPIRNSQALTRPVQEQAISEDEASKAAAVVAVVEQPTPES